MALWIIELNDTAVRVTRDGALIDSSPGIAIVNGREVLTGTAAAARQHLDPRAANSRFWQQLGESPLPGASRLCRHHGDLAYHHLAAILSRCGQPSEAVITVPAHYDEQQLGLLLGICAALKLKVAGLVDSAVAAVAGVAASGDFVVADLHLHHAALIDVTVNGNGLVSRSGVRIIDSAGLARIESAAVDFIADAFLEQARFDPLHEAATEQLLYSNLAGWMNEARGRAELEIAIKYHGSNFGARIETRALERITAMVLAPLAEALEGAPQVLTTAALGGLPGALPLLHDAVLLEPDAAPRAIAEQRLALHSDTASVPYLTELPATAKPSLARAAGPRPVTPLKPSAATHILHAGRAVAVGAGSLVLHADGALSAHGPGVAVSSSGGQLLLNPNGSAVKVNGSPATTPCTLDPGDIIRVGDGTAEFMAISVATYGAA